MNIHFSPPSSLICDGVLMIHIEPNGPNYELKLRGTATPTTNISAATNLAAVGMSVEQTDAIPTIGKEAGASAEANTHVEEGILSCNKRVLYWGGVQLSNSM